MINIAVDQCVGIKKVRQLESLGYKVVVVAANSEPDESWIHRALECGALFVIGADRDIPVIIEQEMYPMVWVDWPDYNKEARTNLVSYVDKRIKFKLDFFHGLLV